ncbi:MAG: hypothetical protein AAGB12_15730 [Pseudomonadota bacterium]
MVKKTTKNLADWIYAYSHINCYLGRDELLWCFDLYSEMLDVFEKYELLINAEFIIPSLIWQGPSADCLGKYKHKEIVRKIPSPGKNYMKKDAIKLIDAEQNNDSVFFKPYRWEINGYGVIYDKHGNPQCVPDVITIESFLSGNFEIWIETFYDVWLSHNLNGEPQPEVYQHNAPRLEQAMQDVEKILGRPPVKGNKDGPEHSDYCEIHGYQLRNFIDDFDNTIVPIDLWGHVKMD